MKPYILIETNMMKKLTGFDGYAFWPFIFMVDKTDKDLLAHEEVHIKQQLKGWLVFFYIKYNYYSWKVGYWNNPYEVEARKAGGLQVRPK